jgi:putative ABC transport system permease protein
VKRRSQILAAIGFSLRSIPRRPGNALVIVIGIAAVVAVLISVLALSSGFTRTIRGGARVDRVLVLGSNADAESSSALSRAAVASIGSVAGLAKDASGTALVSAEVVLVAPVSRRDGTDAYITLRGVGREAFGVRPELRIVSGRMFEPGLRELIVGRTAQQQFVGLIEGSRLRLHDGDWSIVGSFAGGDTVRDSEILADVDTVMSSYQLDAFNSATALLADDRSLATVRAALAPSPSLDVKVMTEPEYLASVSRSMQRLLRTVAIAIGSLMTIGALFGALNTMYSSVAARSSELATLRAIGFRPIAVLVSILTEAMLLALVGAGAGIAVALATFDGRSISTLGGSRWDSQLVYSLTITPTLVAIAVLIACGVGLIGGLIPALRATRTPVAEALRVV